MNSINNMEQMKLEAREMSQYYFKGYATQLNILLAACENYSIKTDDSKKATINSSYNRIQKPYQNLTLYDYEDKPVFCILPEVQRILPSLKNSISKFFEEPISNNFEKIEDKIIHINDFGMHYNNKFKSLINVIVSKPEHQEFTVKVKDLHDYVWEIGLNSKRLD